MEVIKASSIANKSVLSRDSGDKLASTKDLITAPDYSRIIALLVDGNGVFSHSRAVPMERVVSFGRDAVIVTDNEAVLPLEQYPQVKEVLDNKVKVIGKNVFTDRGDTMGTVSDLYFEENSGRICGYELTGGFLGDLSEGHAVLPAEALLSIGPDAVIIRADAVAQLMKQASARLQNPEVVEAQQA